MKSFYITLIFLSFFTTSQSQEIKVDNTIPMYGEVEKSEKHKKIDLEFVEICLKQFGSIDSSVNVQIDNAWRYYYHNDLKTAMKRFNLAWLLNPEYPDSYFGFASLLETQGNFSEAKRFYKIGLNKDSKNNRAEKCYQRIADCKEQLKDVPGTIAYEEITKVKPETAFAYKKIGYFQMQLGHTDEAIKAYDKAIELTPKDANTYKIGHTYIKL